jgi:hypothetical protein
VAECIVQKSASFDTAGLNTQASTIVTANIVKTDDNPPAILKPSDHDLKNLSQGSVSRNCKAFNS